MQRLAAILAISELLIGCSSTTATPVTVADSGADSSTSPDAGADPDSGTDAGSLADAGAIVPDSAVGKRLTWVLAALNGALVTSATINANFSTAFLKAAPEAQVASVFAQLSPKKTWTLTAFEGPVTALSLTAVVTRGDGEYWRIQLSVDATAPSLIDGLLLGIAPNLDPTLSTYEAVDTAMKSTAASVDMLAASLDAAACTPLHSLNTDASLALGSAFKLWVLATVASSIDTGAHAWTDKIAIQDKYKSLPSGTFQDQPEGTMLPILSFANNMISISDNTAADHLLFTMGRDTVETMLTTAHHHDPTLNQPFLGTRELFSLKLLLSQADRQAYVAASTDQKRSLLATYDTTLDPRTYTGPFATPILIDKLEWFATPGDLCNVMLTLKTFADKPATKNVYDVLSINPGVPDDAGQFSYVGYKGGSEPGVLNLTWLLQRRSDQKWVFLTVGFNDTAKAIDEDKATYLASAARLILGK